jgi:hypothetical protein
MGVRRDRLDLRIVEMQESRLENGHRKRKERARKEIRLKDLVKKGTLPFTPTILSMLSQKLDKPGHKITQADVDTYLKA